MYFLSIREARCGYEITSRLQGYVHNSSRSPSWVTDAFPLVVPSACLHSTAQTTDGTAVAITSESWALRVTEAKSFGSLVFVHVKNITKNCNFSPRLLLLKFYLRDKYKYISTNTSLEVAGSILLWYSNSIPWVHCVHWDY